MVITLVLCSGVALAATDAFFGGRALRMTRIVSGKCTNNAYSCIWFDVTNHFRFWNGSTDDYVVTHNPVPDAGIPPKGSILGSTGSGWYTLPPGTAGQVLEYRPTDMGGPAGLKWVNH